MGSRIGRVTAGTAGGLLGLVGLLAHPAPVLIGWLLATLLVGPVTAMCRYSARPHEGFDHVRAGVTATLVTIGAVAVLAGLIVVFGVAVGLLVSMLLGAWIVIRARHRGDDGTDVPGPSALFTPPAAGSPAAARAPWCAAVVIGPPHLVSTAALCGAWQHSFWLVRELPPDDLLAEVVELRRAVLDELERRDPDGFSRWLGSEPRAGSDPGRFLTTRH